MSSHRVSISSNRDAFAAVREALDLLGGIGEFIKPGESVLIKPNGLFMNYREGIVTSPQVVAAVAALVLEAGGKPIVGENDLVYDPSLPNFATHCGKFYHDALVEAGIADQVPLLDTMKDEMVEVDIPEGRVIRRVKLARTALSVDKFIDVPVMKTHDQTQVTMGIKNLKGVLPLSERIRFHEESVEQAIVDLYSLIKPQLVVIDGTIAGEGLGPGDCTPVRMDLVIAGDNAVATDMVGAAVMGFDVSRVKYLNYAVAMGLGPKRLQEIEVLGCPIESVRRKFETAEEVACRQYEEMGVEVISRNVCSGCWAEFRHIYYSLKEDRGKIEGVTFLMGRVTELIDRDKMVVIGNCARAASGSGCFVPGCPPHHFEIDAAARKVAGIGGEPKKLG